MGRFDEAALDRVIAAGCAACGANRLVFRAFLDARLPLLGGEPVGSITWIYDGEKFVDGVFEIACGACKQLAWSADDCPRCHAAGGLRKALDATNAWTVPSACASCGGEEVRYVAFVPARVAYEGRRAEKPRTSTELHDPGFHGWRVDCADCGTVDELRDRCPLCDAPGPLRARPG